MSSGTVKIAVVGTVHPRCESCPDRTVSFSPTVEVIQSICNNSVHGLNFDFLVCVLPAMILHPSTVQYFKEVIHTILDNRYSMHLRKIKLEKCGMLMDSSFIVILASPVCTSTGWNWKQIITEKSLRDMIGDLEFRNPRIDTQAQISNNLICLKPASLNETIYNHNTGTSSQSLHRQVVMDAATLDTPTFLAPLYRHPSKFYNLFSYKLSN